MTLKIFDGFDWLVPDNTLIPNLQADGWYLAGPPTCSDVTAFGRGYSLGFLGGGFGANMSRAMPEHYEGEHIYGHRMIIYEPCRLGFENTMSTGLSQFTLEFSFDGAIFLRNGNGTLLSGCPAGTWYRGSWFFLEIRFTIGVAAELEIRINTKPVISLPVVTLGSGTPLLGYGPGFDVIHYFGEGGAGWLWDDFYLLDTEGDVNNWFLGNVYVSYQAVNGPGDLAQWIIGGSAPAATNWQSVLTPNLNELRYVSTSTPGNRDLYTVNPNLSTPAIYGVRVQGAYRQDDATQRRVKNTLRSHAVDAFGQDHFPDQNYRFYNDVFELSPYTGVGWTDAEVNALQIGPLDSTP